MGENKGCKHQDRTLFSALGHLVGGGQVLDRHPGVGLGNFSMLAMLLNTFQVDLKPGDEPPFPDVQGFQKV
jgi:4-carboxymuconolactone decarboxylase